MVILIDQALPKEIPTCSEQNPADIIIVNYNGGENLVNCLESINPSANAKITVVDNASTDGSPEVVGRTFPHVKLVRSQANMGFGAGNNLGFCESHGDYLAFLNPDTIVEPGWLEALISTLEENRQAGLATSKILLLDQPGAVNTCGHDHHLSGLTLCRGIGQLGGNYAAIEEVPAISGAAFVIHRRLFQKLGGFDPDFFLYMEDTDLSLRARLAGYSCLFVPNSIVYHDYCLTIGELKTFYQERNRYLMLLKIYRWPTLLLLLPTLLLAELITWGFSLIHDRDHLVNKINAYRWVIRNWGKVMQKRLETQALRSVPDRQLLLGTTHRLDYSQIGGGFLPRLASWIFNPLFYILRGFVLAVVWW
jgi:GT2 family glycosyltransferase